MKYALAVENVSKSFVEHGLPSWMSKKKKKFYAIKNASFNVEKGEIFGILGPNGSGKSTLIRMISTLLIPDQGQILVFGYDVVKESKKIKKFINRVSVEASFFKRLSAMENLMYAARLYGLDVKEAKEKCNNILKELNFNLNKVNQPMEDFSRGMQQKIAIARGFLTSPNMLLLDEPTTGLDPKSKLDVQRFIKKIRTEHDITIIITSHDMEEIDRLCTRILILDQGRIIAQGTSSQLKKSIQGKEIYELDTDKSSATKEILESIEGIYELIVEDGKIRFHTKNINMVLNKITEKLTINKISFKNLKKVEPTLEDVFLELTGKPLEVEE